VPILIIRRGLLELSGVEDLEERREHSSKQQQAEASYRSQPQKIKEHT